MKLQIRRHLSLAYRSRELNRAMVRGFCFFVFADFYLFLRGKAVSGEPSMSDTAPLAARITVHNRLVTGVLYYLSDAVEYCRSVNFVDSAVNAIDGY